MKWHPRRIAVIGSSGGIGAAFVDHLIMADTTGYALSRSGRDCQSARGLVLDYDAPETIAQAANSIAEGGPLDLVIVATGLLHTQTFGPEKSLRDLEADHLARVFLINTIGPALVMKHFLPLMRRDGKSVFAALSARVGSISDNRLGGWYGYRAAKAALNQTIRTAAVEHARRWPDCAIIGLHPGTVDTGLSSPFQRQVPKEQLFAPAFAAQRMLAVIDDTHPRDSGKLFAWDGAEVQP